MSATPALTSPALSRRSFIKTGFLATLAAQAAASPAPALAAPPPAAASFTDPTYHFLNRISWGVRPADLLRARRLGIPAYLQEQLSPRMVRLSALVPVSSVLNMSRSVIYRTGDPYGIASRALVSGMIRRAADSPAQLYERMVEFWSDHFNISADDYAPDMLDWLRRVIRPLALGKFRTLLQATARHPAMLLYLDNAYSTREHPNENYGRELMELHTLGVASGYTEADVKAVARAFTGWTTDYRGYSGFVFDPDLHDSDNKTILGHPIAGRTGLEGMQEGIEVLNLLADDPRTARFLCRKLCVRFISDAFAVPGPEEQAFITELATVWQQSDGDIPSVLRALFLSPAFAGSAQKKLRRPLDFHVAACRATGTTYLRYGEQEDHAASLDQLPYGWGPPNGYPDVGAAWATTSSMLARWSVAQDLTNYALPKYYPRFRAVFPLRVRTARTAGELVDQLAYQFFAATLPEAVRTPLIQYVTEGAGGEATLLTAEMRDRKLGPVAGLILSNPYFQWR